jgi:hypothetical protein
VNIEPVQAGSGDPSPDNVRPISGWTGAKVTRTGKNLFNINGGIAYIYPGVAVQDDKIVVSSIGKGATSRVYFSELYEPGTYTFSVKFSGDVESIRFFSPQPFAGGAYSAYYNGYYKLLSNGFTTVTMTKQFTLGVIAQGTAQGQGTAFDLQLELGSTATDYEPYQGDAYDIAFPTEAGTVYGGTLDVTNGKLQVYPYFAGYNSDPLVGPWISSMDKYVEGATPTIGAQVVDMGGTPITYDIDPVTLNLLRGTNTIFADTGDSTLTYRKDVGKLLEALTRPDETDMVADTTYAANSFFTIGGTLYKATAAIATGETIQPGVNCIQTTVADQLTAIFAQL